MPTTKTKRLARKLGLINSKKSKPGQAVEERDSEGTTVTKKRRKRNYGQLLSYLIVIDFESTCWENKKGFQEIIEFPAVLLDLETGKIIDEFQQYVLPRDNPKLSDFCKALTGISQEQVDNGVPVATCLYLFGRWVRKMTEERGVVIMEPGKDYTEEMSLCALATWSDWDLEVCLNYECRRKQIRKPNYFNQWIDVRATYKRFYDQKPSGLSGAMEDLGIVFTGRQHSGIDDARNTAKLCYRMVRDGCRMDITKCISSRPNPSIIHRPSSTTTSACANAEPTPTSTKPILPSKESSPRIEQENAPSNYQTKLSNESPKLVVVPSVSVNNKMTSVDKNNSDKPLTDESGQLYIEHSHVAGADIDDKWTSFDEGLTKDIVRELDDWDNDDSASEQLLGSIQPSTSHKEHHDSSHRINRQGVCSGLPNARPILVKSQSDQGNTRLKAGTPSRTDFVSHVAPVTLLSCPISAQLPSPIVCNSRVSPSKVQNKSASSDICIVNETPPYSVESSVNLRTYLSLSGSTCHTIRQQVPTVASRNFVHSSTRTSNTPQSSPRFTPSALALQHNCDTPNSAVKFQTPSTSEWMKVKRLSCGSTHTSSPSSIHTPSPGSISGELLSSGGKVTPPLCNCGKRTKRRTVSNPGPNEGRTFYACPNGKASDQARGCGFFKWEKVLDSCSSSPQSFIKSHCQSRTASCNILEPEYFESKR